MCAIDAFDCELYVGEGAMIQTDLIEVLRKLPESLQQEVLHYAEFLAEKYLQDSIAGESPKKKREAGALKGKIWMSDDFDASLEDFSSKEDTSC